jgi:hypothetical protein
MSTTTLSDLYALFLAPAEPFVGRIAVFAGVFTAIHLVLAYLVLPNLRILAKTTAAERQDLVILSALLVTHAQLAHPAIIDSRG